jgi:hypothetical protein
MIEDRYGQLPLDLAVKNKTNDYLGDLLNPRIVLPR